MDSTVLQAQVAKLHLLLKQVKFNFEALDEQGHFLEFLGPQVEEMYHMPDTRFVAGVYKILHNKMEYKPTLSQIQFLSKGFAEKKISMLIDMIQFAKRLHSEKAKAARAKASSPPASIPVEPLVRAPATASRPSEPRTIVESADLVRMSEEVLPQLPPHPALGSSDQLVPPASNGVLVSVTDIQPVSTDSPVRSTTRPLSASSSTSRNPWSDMPLPPSSSGPLSAILQQTASTPSRGWVNVTSPSNRPSNPPSNAYSHTPAESSLLKAATAASQSSQAVPPSPQSVSLSDFLALKEAFEQFAREATKRIQALELKLAATQPAVSSQPKPTLPLPTTAISTGALVQSTSSEAPLETTSAMMPPSAQQSDDRFIALHAANVNAGLGSQPRSPSKYAPEPSYHSIRHPLSSSTGTVVAAGVNQHMPPPSSRAPVFSVRTTAEFPSTSPVNSTIHDTRPTASPSRGQQHQPLFAGDRPQSGAILLPAHNAPIVPRPYSSALTERTSGITPMASSAYRQPTSGNFFEMTPALSNYGGASSYKSTPSAALFSARGADASSTRSMVDEIARRFEQAEKALLGGRDL